MLPPLRLKTGRLSVLTGSDQIRLVMFMTGRFAFKYSQFWCIACREVVSWYLTVTGQEVLSDNMVTV